MNIDILFSRQLLLQVHKDARKVYLARKGVLPNLHKVAWVYSFGRDHWEFHGPDDFYWCGSASNAYEARSKGWLRWIENPNCKG